MTSSRLNGLVDVVVAAQRQAADLVLGGVAGRQEDDRDPGASAAQAPDDVEPVHVGQHHVEHDEVGAVALSGLYRLGSGGCRDDVETRVTQAGRQQLKDVRLVLDDEQPRIRSLPRIGQRVHSSDRRPR